MDDNFRLQIEAYLTDDLSLEDKLVFEEQLHKDKKLQKEVSLMKQLNLYLIDSADAETSIENDFTFSVKEELKQEKSKQLREKIESIKINYQLELVARNQFRNLLFVAASVALLIISYIGYNSLTTTTSNELYLAYYSTNDLPKIIKRSRENSFLEQGVVLFNDKEYQKAIEAFNNYIENTPDINSSVYIYSGLANTEIENYKQAIMDFDKMITSNSIDNSKGFWFKALLYLKKKDVDNAKKTLIKLTESQSKYKYKEAIEILDKIN